jgi:hypothetical protein
MDDETMICGRGLEVQAQDQLLEGDIRRKPMTKLEIFSPMRRTQALGNRRRAQLSLIPRYLHVVANISRGSFMKNEVI